MSRIGKKPIAVPSSVKVNVDASKRAVNVEGPKGKMSYSWHPVVDVAWNEDDKTIACAIAESKMQSRDARAQWGTTRSRIQNLVTGVTEGYEIKLQIIGVGWNAQAQGNSIRLNVGYCHPVDLPVPQGVTINVEKDMVTINGPDKQVVGQFAANIRSKRPPEPYNGKGIKYLDEIIIRKQGKAFGA